MEGFKQLLRRLRKDAWMLPALAAAVIACLMLGAAEDSASRTDEEARLARVLSAMEGAGQVDVAVFYDASGDTAVPCGAVVVAEGAEDVAVRLQLSRAVETLLDIDPSQVNVFKRKEGK